MIIEIGSIYWISIPYYDKVNQQDDFKYRPALILHQSDADEYNVLPVSRCQNTCYINPDYDIPINLKDKSYIRVHKQTTAHVTKIGNKVCSVKDDFPQVYSIVKSKYEEYSKEINDGMF